MGRGSNGLGIIPKKKVVLLLRRGFWSKYQKWPWFLLCSDQRVVQFCFHSLWTRPHFHRAAPNPDSFIILIPTISRFGNPWQFLVILGNHKVRHRNLNKALDVFSVKAILETWSYPIPQTFNWLLNLKMIQIRCYFVWPGNFSDYSSAGSE